MNAHDAGEIRVNGKPVHFRNNRDAIRQGIAYVSEDRLSLGLVMPQTIADNTVVSVMRRLVGALGLIDGARRAQTIERWIFKELRVKTNTADRPVQQLSGGNQQRVVLAKWLATNPRVLILDSPTVGVDIGAKAGIFQIVRRTRRARPCDPSCSWSRGGCMVLHQSHRPCHAFGTDRRDL